MPDTFSSDVDNNSAANLSMGWLLPLLLLVLAAGLFFYFLNGSGNTSKSVAPQFIISPSDTAANKKTPVSPDSVRP